MNVRDSLTPTLPRLRRPLAMMLVSLVGMMLVTLAAPLPMAYAGVLTGPPDSLGNYAQCNVSYNHVVDNVASTTQHNDLNVRCNYGNIASDPPIAVHLDATFNDATTCTNAPTGCFGGPGGNGMRINPSWTATSGVCKNNDGSNTTLAVAGGDRNTSNLTTYTSACGDFTSKWVTSVSNCQIQYQFTGNKPCKIFSQAGGTNTVQYPADYYPGGTAGPVLDAVKGTGWPCSRTLDNTSTMVGSFQTADVTQSSANVTVTQAVWAWGDASTNTTITGAGPTFQANHTFPAIGSMPTNGWTTSVTVTYTATSGHLFSDGSSSATSVCSLRVDFLHPDQSTPNSTDNGSTGDSSLDSCIPSGWGILNPINLIGGVGCMLKKLFIPTSATSSSLSSMWTGITSKAPFSILYEVVTFIPQNLDDFVYSVNAYSPVVSHGVGSTNTSPICASDNATTNNRLGLCNYSGAYPFEGGGPFRVDGGTGHVSDPNVYLVRQIALFALGLLFFYACYRGVGEILK